MPILEHNMMICRVAYSLKGMALGSIEQIAGVKKLGQLIDSFRKMAEIPKGKIVLQDIGK